MDDLAILPVPARPSDEAVVLQLASELHGISIASYHECLKIAKALLDVGCPSLMSLVALPELKKDPWFRPHTNSEERHFTKLLVFS